jgi:UDP-glucose 4-epimerase
MGFLKGKRIFLTGGAGFIGANLIRALLDCEAEVHALIRASTPLWRVQDVSALFHIHPFSLLESETLERVLKEIRPHYIFHLANTSGHPLNFEEKEESLKTNVLGTFYLLEAASQVDFECFVHFGGSLEYGFKSHPIHEEELLKPFVFRGASKAASTLLCLQFALFHRRSLVVLRPFSVYGYWESPGRLIPTAILSVLRNQTMALTAPGYVRDFIFIEDVIEACLKAVQRKWNGEIINLGSGVQRKNEDVVRILEGFTERPLKVREEQYPTRDSDTLYWVADIRRAKELLDWTPRYSLEEGLEKTLNWFKEHQDFY